MKNIYILIFLFLTTSGYAQTISTFYQNASVDDGLAFDSEGNLYGSQYTWSIVWKFTPDGERSKFMTGLDTPNGLVKVAPDGSYETYIQGNGLVGPVGLAYDENENLYVGNYTNSWIYKVNP